MATSSKKSRTIAGSDFAGGGLPAVSGEEWEDLATAMDREGGRSEMATKLKSSGAIAGDHPAENSSSRVGLEGGGSAGNRMEGGTGDNALIPSPQPPASGGEQEARGIELRGAPNLPAATLIRQSGDLRLPAEVQYRLSMSPNPAEVEIRPDGMVYMPWNKFAGALDLAFGVGNWCQVPQGTPLSQDGFVCWQFDLYCLAVWVSTAIGEHPDPGNRRMSLANRAEAAKSDALVKNCKALGIFRELWDVAWRLDWQAEYAIRVWALQSEYSSKGAWLWRRKDRDPFFKEKSPKESDIEQGSNRRDYADDARDHISSIQKED